MGQLDAVPIPQKAWRDTRKWLLNSFIAWIVAILGCGVLSSIFVPIPAVDTILYRTLFGFLGAAIALFLIIGITYIVHLWITPMRQRNEAYNYIADFQNSYAYALSLDSIDAHPDPTGNYITLNLSNNLEKPIEFEMDWTKTYVEINGKRLPKHAERNTGAIITKSKPLPWVLPYNFEEISQARKVVIHYELKYGNPGNFLYRQIRELNLHISYLSRAQLSITYTEEKRQDVPIKKQVVHK
jgi:hypothetical protein